MKYKIFLDSNQVFSKKDALDSVFNNSIPELNDFLKEHELENVEICLPDLVIRERIQHKMEDAQNTIKITNEQIKLLNKIGHKIEPIKPEEDYKKKFEESAEKFIKNNKVIKVTLPPVSKEELIDRAISKMRPFNDKGAGFKDTLLYLSIIEDALNSKGSVRYIFCTDDDIFHEEEIVKEFKETTGKELYVVRNIVKVREKMDEIVPLNLHLQTRNKMLSDVVKKHIGDLMVTVNKQLTNRNDGLHWAFNEPLTARYRAVMGLNKDGNEIVGYNFKDITFLSFEETGKDAYEINFELEVIIKYGESKSGGIHVREADPNDIFNAQYETTRAVLTTVSSNSYFATNLYKPSTKSFRISAQYDESTDTFSIDPYIY